jgi:hypothetical protein
MHGVHAPRAGVHPVAVPYAHLTLNIPNGQRFYLDPINKSFMVIFALDFDHIKDSDVFWEWFRTTPMDKL